MSEIAQVEIAQVEVVIRHTNGTGKRCQLSDVYSAALHLLRKCQPEQLQHLKLHDLHDLQMQMQGRTVVSKPSNTNTKETT